MHPLLFLMVRPAGTRFINRIMNYGKDLFA